MSSSSILNQNNLMYVNSCINDFKKASLSVMCSPSTRHKSMTLIKSEIQLLNYLLYCDNKRINPQIYILNHVEDNNTKRLIKCKTKSIHSSSALYCQLFKDTQGLKRVLQQFVINNYPLVKNIFTDLLFLLWYYFQSLLVAIIICIGTVVQPQTITLCVNVKEFEIKSKKAKHNTKSRCK